MALIKDIITPVEKCLQPNDTLHEAIEFMKTSKWNTVPVTDCSGVLIGVFTRSALYQMVLMGKELSTPIDHFIRKDVETVREDVSFEELEKLVQESEVGTGIVTNSKGKPIGLITKTDLVMTFLEKSQSYKEQLETILHTSQLGALITSSKGKILFVNDKLTEMMDKSREDLLHIQIQRILPDLTINLLEKEVHRRIKIGDHHFIVRITKRSSGQEGFIALFQNISELENMAQELETVKNFKSILQTVIHNSFDGLVMINDKKQIIFMSPSVIELFDLDGQRVTDASIDTVLPQLELPKVVKTGVADISDFMEIKGIHYMAHRIPVYQGDRIIGAIGKIVFRQLHEVRERFRRLENKRGQHIPTRSKNSESSRFTFDEIITKDQQMEKLIRSGIKAAKGRSTILIRGESGTGKELFAHAIHSTSSRKSGPFITVNCAAIPEHLLESEFFGYEEGAFTGAKQKGKVGKFDLAHGGTLFLDEVGDMSMQMQAKLLRVLQEREFYRVGGSERVHVDVRIISATNRPLEEMVETGDFREDLFYRLNVISFEIPPLRKRRSDIFLLSEGIIKDLNNINGTSITGIDPVAQSVMMEYDWPGNVRELKNVLERAMIFADHGKIQLEDLPDYVIKKVNHEDHHHEKDDQRFSMMEKAEQEAIFHALKETNGNKSRAAKLLGISRSVLYDKLKKYELSNI
ncbi:sigma-54-dependent Fis family transcriptional regulator [Bacillus sp. FJAT-47783]|uniref:sigma-54-dependent Fis family transcriptional regulator n=1 Tax=Bacillus sp. FJAT-47783 TaxID=2922712 RepID=UPI001FADC0AF|nr:sigma-54-dependent Fis family transcriptional regulator [Bacillus sp. FJAT-47783]